MNQGYNCIRSVFDEAQRGLRNPTVLLANLKKLHDGSKESDFQDSFLWHLKRTMVIFDREPAVERIMDFVAKYCTLDSHHRREEEQQQQPTSGSEGGDYSTSGFLQFIFLFLLDSHNANDKAVRFRVCQLINKLLNNMGEGAVIDDDLADRILQSMLVRLTDKFPAVRMQAVAAISRLQDPTDAECPVVSSYLRVMSDDPSAEVRRTVLLNIGLSVHSLDGVLRRTRDITASVRKLAFRILAVNVNIKSLTIAQRVQLLSDGLNDRSDPVKEACVALLQSWCQSFNGDVVRLLKCLDVEGCTDIAELVMKTILKGLSKAELQSKHIYSLKRDQESEGPVKVSYERLDPETALYWRCLGEHLRSLDVAGQELFDELLPEVSGFCDYIQGYVDSQLRETVPEENAEFPQLLITQQLLILVGVMDLSDEVGRKHLSQMVHDMLVLPDIPQSLVEVLHDRYVDLQPDESSRIQELVEIIADVRQPITIRESAQNMEDKRKWELKLAGVGVKLNQLREEMEECVAGQEFARAAELKQQIVELEEAKESLAAEESSFSQTIREEKDDPETLLKCLTIASEMLQGIISSGLNPTLATLVETLILPCVQNEDPLVRNMAVKSLGLCALLSCEFARTYLVLFLQVAQFDQEFVRVTALQVVFDLLHTFGFEAFKETALPKPQSGDPDTSESSQGEEGEKGKEKKEQEEEDDTPEDPDEGGDRQPTDTAAVVLTILTGVLDSESNDLRGVAAEGLAKLLVSGRVLSAKLFSRLLLLWYNPTTEDDDKLRHCLGVFFPVFAFSSRTNQEVVEEASIPTLETLFSAPVSSPLASVNVSNVAELLVALTDPKNLEKCRNATGTTEVASSHVSLSLAVANAILSDPAGPGVRVLCKVLTMMDLSGCTQSTVKELKVLTSRTMEEVSDKTSLRSLNKFNTTLSQLSGGKDSDRGEASQTEPEDETRVNTCAEEEQEQDDTLAHLGQSQTSNEDGSDSHRVLQAKADQSQTQTGQHTDMPTTMKTPVHGKTPKPKSKATGNRRGKKTTATDQQLSPSNFIDDETPARRTKYTRKSKSYATGRCNSILAEEDESSEKENTACSDEEDVFCR